MGAGTTRATTAPAPSRSPSTVRACSTARSSQATSPAGATAARASWITIYANAEHVYMIVAGMRFDTSARSRTGSRWTMEARPSDGFAVTHPAGL